MDIAIAASALEHGAHLWTLNRADFKDIPGLKLYDPSACGSSAPVAIPTGWLPVSVSPRAAPG